MKISYLIDTDWIIDHFNQQEKITRKLNDLIPEGIALSIISLAELYEGVIYSKDPAKSQKVLSTFIKEFPALELNESICKIFGLERGKLRQKKKVVSDFDLLIASTCLHHNLTLLTNNRKHYKMVDGLKIILPL